MKHVFLFLIKCFKNAVCFRFLSVFLLCVSFVFSNPLTIDNLDNDLAALRYHFQASEDVLLHQFTISSSNAVTISNISVDVFSYENPSSIAQPNVIYSLINVSNQNEILIDTDPDNPTSFVPFSFENEQVTLRVALDLKILSISSNDPMGKNLAGKQLYAKITFTVDGEQMIVNVDPLQSTKVVVDGINQLSITKQRGASFDNANLLFPSEYAVMSKIDFGLSYLARDAGKPVLLLKEIRLNKITDSEEGFENVIEKIIFMRQDELKTRFTNSGIAFNDNVLTIPNNQIDLSLPPNGIAENILVFDVDSDLNTVIVDDNNFNGQFKIEDLDDARSFYIIYKIKDSLLVPTVNLMAQVTDIFMKVEEGGVMKDILLDDSNPADSFLSSSYAGLGYFQNLDDEFSLVALEANNFLLPNLDVIDNTNTGVNYGANNKNIPVLKFTLKSFNSEVLLSTLNVRTTRGEDEVNTGIPFEFDQANSFLNEVTKVSIYVDVPPIGEFGSEDILLIEKNAIDIIAENDEGGSDVFEVQFDLSSDEFLNQSGVQELLTIDREDGEKDGDKSFIITYDLDAVVNQGSALQAFISNVETSLIASSLPNNFLNNWSVDQNPIVLGGDLPLPLLADALSVPISLSSIQLVDVSEALSGFDIYPGQRQVDVMSIVFKNDALSLNDLTALFFSEAMVFSSSVGFKKLYLYDGDDLISEVQSPSFPAQTTQMPNISLSPTATGVGQQQFQNLTVKADIGPNVIIDNLNLFFNGLISESPGFSFVGAVPSPISPVSVAISQLSNSGVLVTASVTQANKINDSSLSHSDVVLDIYIQNTHNQSISILNIIPKVYFDRIDGLDISALFDFEPELNSIITFPHVVNPGGSLHYQVYIKYINKLREGSAYLDVDLDFLIDNGSGVGSFPRLFYQRYIDTLDNWQQNAVFFQGEIANNLSSILLLNQSNSAEEWQYPLHILDVIYSPNRLDSFAYQGHVDKSFISSSAVELGSYFYIYFQENMDIDFSSLEISYQGQSMTRLANASGQTFGYFIRREGDVYRIEVLNVPDTQGQVAEILLSLQDGVGNQLEDLSLRFISSSKATLDRVLFHPNPYKLGQIDDTLKLGLNLTKRASIELYVFNHNGRLIDTVSIPLASTSIGYNLFENELLELEKKLRPGLYVIKLIATDADGNEDISVTRMAAY